MKTSGQPSADACGRIDLVAKTSTHFLIVIEWNVFWSDDFTRITNTLSIR